MKNHPTDEELLRYCEARRSAAAESARPEPVTKSHLAERCERCEERVAMYREVLDSLEAPALRRAPEEWVREALRRVEEHAPESRAAARGILGAIAASAERIRQAFREVQLGLVLDSGAEAALPGIRAAGTLTPRQLLFESEQGSLHLQMLEAARGRVDLLGQFVPVTPSARGRKVRAVLRREGTETQRTLTSSGAFRWNAIPAGVVEIRVLVGDAVLATGPFPLRSGPDA